jgi:HSP90 family molecular chaperone
MSSTAYFQVDPRLAALLSENYRSTEQALKELIDNSSDADAENVWIVLPDSMTNTSIVIRDDGLGMTEKEVTDEYLAIASHRRMRKGSDRSFLKNRSVKGRKGIGKFAGFAAAEVMGIDTKSHGKRTKLRINKEKLLRSSRDLEKIDLPLDVSDCEKKLHGTRSRCLT